MVLKDHTKAIELLNEKQDISNPYLYMAYWEQIYKLLFSEFTNLIKNKGQYILRLSNQDLTELDPKEARKVNIRINRLEEELNILFGTKLFFEQVFQAFQESTNVVLGEAIKKDQIIWQLIHRIEEQKKDIATLKFSVSDPVGDEILELIIEKLKS